MSLNEHRVHHVLNERKDLARDFGVQLCGILEKNSIFDELQCSAVVIAEAQGLQIRVERPMRGGVDYVVTHLLYEEIEGADLTLRAMLMAGGLMSSLLLKVEDHTSCTGREKHHDGVRT